MRDTGYETSSLLFSRSRGLAVSAVLWVAFMGCDGGGSSEDAPIALAANPPSLTQGEAVTVEVIASG